MTVSRNVDTSRRKIAIITGASSGLGEEYAKQIAVDETLISRGLAELWLVARREDRLEELADNLPIETRIFALDLTEESSFYTLEEALRTEPVDVLVLVNSAGFGQVGPFTRIPSEVHQSMLRLNVEALTLLSQIVLPYLIEGSIILNIASVAGFMPQTNFNVYSASKSYVIRFSRALHDELKDKNIHVTAVCPGPMETEFFDVAGRNNNPEDDSSRITQKIKDIGVESPERVVAVSLRRALRGKDMSVTGFAGKILRVVGKVVPHGIVLWIERKMGM